MVVVHCKTYEPWSLLEALAPTDDSGTSNLEFPFLLMNTVSTSTQNMGNIVILQGYLSPLHRPVSSIYSGAAWNQPLVLLT